MPEFRFRRKKQNRRNTLHDPDETAKQIKDAKKLVEPVPDSPQDEPKVPPKNGGVLRVGLEKKPSLDKRRSSFIQEREKFFELLKTKYPEQASSLEVGDLDREEEMGVVGGGDLSIFKKDKPLVNGHTPSGHSPSDTGKRSSVEDDKTEDEDVSTKTESPSNCSPITSSSRFGECLYLRHGRCLRHCPMPSPITLSTIKNLFINMFELNPVLLTSNSSQIYIQNKKTMLWNKLENVSMVTDHCTLLLADSALSQSSAHVTTTNSQTDSDINMPLDHLTPNSQLTPPDSLNSSDLKCNGHLDDSNDETPTSSALPKKNGLWRSGHTYNVQDLSSLPDNLPLQKNPPSLLPHTYPSPSIISSTPSSNGNHSLPVVSDSIIMRARGLRESVCSLKTGLSDLKQDHLLRIAELNAVISNSSHRIAAAISAFGEMAGLRAGRRMSDMEATQKERLALHSMEDGYRKCSEGTFKDLNILTHAVEEMRVDVVDRHCKVIEDEVNKLKNTLYTTSESLKDIKAQYEPLEVKMKKVMEGELKVIVKEEKFLEEEFPKLEEAFEKCERLNSTLQTLHQYATVQSHRTPLVPHFPPTAAPDDTDRSALMENIAAITPNHTHRMESLGIAEALREKRKQFLTEKPTELKEFEKQLLIRKQQLHKAVSAKEIENRQEMKLKALYMEDKYKHGIKKHSDRHTSNDLDAREGGGSKEAKMRFRGVSTGKRQLRAASEERQSRNEDFTGMVRGSLSQDGLLTEEEESIRQGKYGQNLNVEENVVNLRQRKMHELMMQERRAKQRRSQELIMEQMSHSQDSHLSSSFSAKQRRSQELTMEQVSHSQDNHLPSSFSAKQRRSQELTMEQVSHSQDSYLPSSFSAKQRRSQELTMEQVSHSQDSHLPSKNHFHDEGYNSHSQPDPSPFTKEFHLAAPPRGRRGHGDLNSQIQELKRKSIGYAGELEDVRRYYDTLERKHRAASKDSGLSFQDSNTSKREEGSQRGVFQHDGSGPSNSLFSNSSVSGSSTISAGTGSSGGGMLQRVSHFKPSSLATTSVSSSEPLSSSGESKKSPSHTRSVGGATNKSFASRLQKPSQGQGSQVAHKSKRPQMSGFPSRYSTSDDYHSKGKSSRIPSSANKSPSRSKGGKNQAKEEKGQHEGQSIASSDKKKGGKKVLNKFLKMERRAEANEDGLQSTSNHSLPEEKTNMSEIFDSDTLIARNRRKSDKDDESEIPERRHANQSDQLERNGMNPPNKRLVEVSQGQSSQQSDITSPRHHSSPQHQVNVHSRFRNVYPQHVPTAFKKMYQSHGQSGPTGGVNTTHELRDATHGARVSQQSVTRTSGKPGSKNLRFQYQSEPQSEGYRRAHPSTDSSGIPIRFTKSAHVPFVSHDSALTSYPRSHTTALQMRSASNGRVHPSYQNTSNIPRQGGQHGGGGIPHTHWEMHYSGGGGPYRSPPAHAGSFGTRMGNVNGTSGKGVIVGSLV